MVSAALPKRYFDVVEHATDTPDEDRTQSGLSLSTEGDWIILDFLTPIRLLPMPVDVAAAIGKEILRRVSEIENKGKDLTEN
jgi:hypothetical protein